jgi:peptide/nickel transport system permease protein
VIRRVISSLVTLVILTAVLFWAVHALGSPVSLILGPEATDAQYASLSHEMGYDRPVLTQFGEFMGNALRGDLGESIRRHEPAVDVVLRALPKTLFLGGLAFAISLVGILLGLLAAVRPRSIIDGIVNSASFAMMAAPNFWIALLGIYFFALQLHWLPTSGFRGYGDIRFMVLPALVLSMSSLARFAQITRTAVMEELAKPYVQTATAKGLGRPVILWLHVMKNSSISIVTVAGDELASIVNGTVIMETIFGWPGMGYLMVSAIQQRDLPLVVAAVVIAATLVMLINFLVDMIYLWIDPRIQYQ